MLSDDFWLHGVRGPKRTSAARQTGLNYPIPTASETSGTAVNPGGRGLLRDMLPLGGRGEAGKLPHLLDNLLRAIGVAN